MEAGASVFPNICLLHPTPNKHNFLCPNSQYLHNTCMSKSFQYSLRGAFHFKVDVLVYPQVFCRIRPLGNRNDESCLSVLNPTVLKLTAPEVMDYKLIFYKRRKSQLASLYICERIHCKLSDSIQINFVSLLNLPYIMLK